MIIIVLTEGADIFIMQDILAFFHTHEELIYALRIILAGICGGIIGVERTLRQKGCGLPHAYYRRNGFGADDDHF